MFFFFKKPFAKDIYKHKQQDGRCVLFQYNLFFRVKRSFPHWQNRRMNTEHKGRDTEPESLAFIYKNMVACVTFAVITFPEVKETFALHEKQDNESVL